MECMASGIPTIVSANSGHLDLVATGGCVALTTQRSVPVPTRLFRSTEGWGESDPDEVVEVLERLWNDRESARALGHRASDAMAAWSWSRQVPRLLDALASAAFREKALKSARRQADTLSWRARHMPGPEGNGIPDHQSKEREP